VTKQTQFDEMFQYIGMVARMESVSVAQHSLMIEFKLRSLCHVASPATICPDKRSAGFRY
jgi:hypothetical protein